MAAFLAASFSGNDSKGGVSGPGSDCSSPSSSDTETEDDLHGKVEQYFAVRASTGSSPEVEQDIIQNRCVALRKLMRQRPCPPLHEDGQARNYADRIEN